MSDCRASERLSEEVRRALRTLADRANTCRYCNDWFYTPDGQIPRGCPKCAPIRALLPGWNEELDTAAPALPGKPSARTSAEEAVLGPAREYAAYLRKEEPRSVAEGLIKIHNLLTADEQTEGSGSR